MPWCIRVDDKAAKQIEKLDKTINGKILKFLRQLETLENPRLKGEPLIEDRFKGLWRYRVSDYRLLCDIRDSELVVLVVDVEHRSKLYR